MIDYYDPRLNLVFTGCGLIGSYHAGVVALLKQVWPHQPFHKASGCSSGALMAVFIISGISLEEIVDAGLQLSEIALEALKKPFFNPVTMRENVERILNERLPSDAHLIVNEKLAISVTRVHRFYKFEGEIIKHFNTRQHLISAISASTFIPGWSGSIFNPPLVGKYRCIDGAYADNKPCFELTNEQKKLGFKNILIGPFEGDELDVRPPDSGISLMKVKIFGIKYRLCYLNILRGWHAMSPNHANQLTYIQLGHETMKEYVLKNNLVRCKDCYHKIFEQSSNEDYSTSSNLVESNFNQQSSSSSSSSKFQKQSSTNSCLACLFLMEKVDSLTLPNSIIKACKLSNERVF